MTVQPYNPAHYHAAKNRTRAILSEFRMGGCQACDERDEACLVAHHLDPAVKDAEINRLCAGTGSHARLRKELEKCVCLCHNCHFKLHAGRPIKIRKSVYSEDIRTTV